MSTDTKPTATTIKDAGANDKQESHAQFMRRIAKRRTAAYVEPAIEKRLK